jgi:hypothetical protein
MIAASTHARSGREGFGGCSFPGDCGFRVAGLLTYFPDASCRIEASFL